MDAQGSLATGHGHGRCTAEFSRPGIYGDPERPAAQLRYVTICQCGRRDPARGDSFHALGREEGAYPL